MRAAYVPKGRKIDMIADRARTGTLGTCRPPGGIQRGSGGIIFPM